MSGLLSPEQVLNWKPEALSAAGAKIASRSKAIEDGQHEVSAQQKLLNAEWEGRAGDGAQSSFSKELTSYGDLVDWLRSRSQVLDAGASTLAEAKTLVEAAIMAAEAAGLHVNMKTGAASVPAGVAKSLSLVQAGHAQNLATEHTHEICAALNKAMNADHQVESQLLGTPMSNVELSVATSGMDFRGYDLGANLQPASQKEWASAMGLSLSLCSFPAAGVAIVGGMPGAGSGTGYYGGGFLVGPDGLKYPLAMPEVEKDGHLYNNNSSTDNSIMSLGNRDRHWVTTGTTSGVFSYGPKTGLLTKILAGAGIAAGAPVVAGPLVKRNDLLKYLKSEPQSEQINFDYFNEPHQLGAPDGRQPDVPYDDSDPRLAQYVDRDAAGPTGLALNTVINTAQGVHTAMHMDDNRTHGYQVVFQQAPDGRRRAILRVVDVYSQPESGKTTVMGGYGWISPDGQLKVHPFQSPRPTRTSAGPM